MKKGRLRFQVTLAGLCLLSVMILPLPSFAQDDPQSQAAPKVEDKAPPAATDPDVVSTQPGVQVLDLGEFKVECTMPANFVLRKRVNEGKSEFSLSGPRNPDGTGPGLLFLSITLPPGTDNLDSKTVMTQMLEPMKGGLSGYQMTSGSAVDINGKSFENSVFSGTLPDGKNIKGFYYITRLKNAFSVIAGRDSMPAFDKSEATLRDIVKTCKISE